MIELTLENVISRIENEFDRKLLEKICTIERVYYTLRCLVLATESCITSVPDDARNTIKLMCKDNGLHKTLNVLVSSAQKITKDNKAEVSQNKTIDMIFNQVRDNLESNE